MTCNDARSWLLRADDPHSSEEGPPEVRAHLDACPQCQRLRDRLARLETAYRLAPTPPQADEACRTFLDRLPQRPPRRPRLLLSSFLPPRWLAAALVFLTLGLGLWGVMLPPRAQASDVVEQLIDWNLQLAAARSPEERARLYARQAPRLEEEVRTAPLPRPERDLASSLLESGSRLARQADPVEQADCFDFVADSLLASLRTASARGDAQAVARQARRYRRVEKGIAANLERAARGRPLEPRQKGRVERLVHRDEARAEELNQLLQTTHRAHKDGHKAPDHSRKNKHRGKHRR